EGERAVRRAFLEREPPRPVHGGAVRGVHRDLTEIELERPHLVALGLVALHVPGARGFPPTAHVLAAVEGERVGLPIALHEAVEVAAVPVQPLRLQHAAHGGLRAGGARPAGGSATGGHEEQRSQRGDPSQPRSIRSLHIASASQSPTDLPRSRPSSKSISRSGWTITNEGVRMRSFTWQSRFQCDPPTESSKTQALWDVSHPRRIRAFKGGPHG